jgi:hypothetical protein
MPLYPRAGSLRLDITDEASGSANGIANNSFRSRQGDPCLALAPKPFVRSRTKSVDKEPHRLESQHSFLPCSSRHLFHPCLQAAFRPSFNSRRRQSAPLVPCAI